MVKLNETDICYNTFDYPYHKIGKCNFDVKPKSKYTYYSMPATFDIETTTIECEEPYGFMYHWQFCLEGYVCMGRTWEDFVRFIDKIRKKMYLYGRRTLVIYSHFLSYEFQFVRGFIQFDRIFAKEKRKILTANSNGLEFRCSYFLSNMSLGKFCENSELCTHNKMSGDDYDYSVIRTPETPLTKEELQYCYNDVKGLEECILTLLQEDTLSTIPLTNTGYVRRDCKKAMSKNTRNRSIFVRTQLSLELYQFLRKIFRGGDTHANRFYVDCLLQDLDSYDLQSSYPAWIMTEYFPMGKLTPFSGKKRLKVYKEKYCLFLKIAFYNIRVYANEPHTYMDIAHCERYRKITNDNGRVKSAEYVEYYCTEIDLEIINECYHYDKYILIEGYYSERGYLPNELKQVMMDYYDKKTTLKGLQEKVYEYLKSKNRLNSIFGMMVMSILHEENLLINDEWFCKLKDPAGQIADYYAQRKGFLPYQWGIYVTAHARKRLRGGIRATRIGRDYLAVYWDTDCVKFFSNQVVIERFEKMNERRIAECQKSEILPVSYKNGKPYWLGVWDRESHIDYFKTYGAKKYCRICNHVFTITVAGMNKKKGALAVARKNGGHPVWDEKCGGVVNYEGNPCERFSLGETYEDVGRTISYYNDDSTVRNIIVDGVEITTAANIGTVETTYTLGITNDFLSLVENAIKYRELREVNNE